MSNDNHPYWFYTEDDIGKVMIDIYIIVSTIAITKIHDE